MSMRLSCALDGVRPESLDGSIRVEDVTEEASELARVTARRALGGGSLPICCERTALRVRILLSVREPSAIRRAVLLQRLALWAQGELLTVSTRPGQRLRVRLAALPSARSALDWPRVLTFTFTAMEAPWWEELRPVTASLDSLEQPDGSLYVPGDAESAPADAVVTVLEDGLTALQLICGETALRLEGLDALTDADASDDDADASDDAEDDEAAEDEDEEEDVDDL